MLKFQLENPNAEAVAEKVEEFKKEVAERGYKFRLLTLSSYEPWDGHKLMINNEVELDVPLATDNNDDVECKAFGEVFTNIFQGVLAGKWGCIRLKDDLAVSVENVVSWHKKGGTRQSAQEMRSKADEFLASVGEYDLVVEWQVEYDHQVSVVKGSEESLAMFKRFLANGR